MSENIKTIYIPQYACQYDFPLDFKRENWHPDPTSAHPDAPPSFWFSRYQEQVPTVQGKVRVLFHNEKEENSTIPTLDAKPEFNVTWKDDNSFEVNDDNNKIIIKSFIKKYNEHKKNVNSIDVSPSEAFIVTGEDEGIVKLLEMETGNNERVFKGHLGDITKVRFFPSGSVLLTAATDFQLKIWSVLDGSNPVTLKGHSRGITDTAIISRGRNILSSSKDGSICLWECGSSSIIRKICQLDTPIHKMAMEIAPSSMSLSSATATKTLDPREVETQGKVVLALTDDSFNAYDLGSENHQPVFQGKGLKTSNFSSIATDLTNHHVITGNEEGVIALWDIRNISQPYCMFRRNGSTISSLNLASSNDLLISQTDGQLYLCDISNANTESSSILVKKEFVGSDLEPWYDVSLTPSGKIIAGGRNGMIQRYSLN